MITRSGKQQQCAYGKNKACLEGQRLDLRDVSCGSKSQRLASEYHKFIRVGVTVNDS
jgi:hypothetical protein